MEDTNELIAEFMGYKVMKENDFLNYNYPKNTNLDNIMIDVAIMYHKSWDWLMPVVEKINRELYLIKIEYSLEMVEVRILLNSNELEIAAGYSSEVSNVIKAYYQAVVEFIKWESIIKNN